MAKKPRKKPARKPARPATLKAVRKLKPGFNVSGARPSTKSTAIADTAAPGGQPNVQVVGSPSLAELRQKYGLAPAADRVPNGADPAAEEPLATEPTNEVFEVRPKGSADNPAESKTLIVSKYTKRPVSAQG